MNSNYISALDLSRFEHAKEEFKQQVCLNVDTLFNVFLAELNTNQQRNSNESLCQLSNNETNTEQFNHNNERNNNQLISNQQQEVSLNIESQQSGLNLEIHSPNGRSHFDTDLSADFPIQNNQQQQQMLNVTIKQEILDEDEQPYVRDDNQEQPLLNDGHMQNTQNIELSNLNSLNPEKATNNQTSFGESQVTDCISYSYDDDIFDEELLREVKKEILDEEEEKQIVLAKRRKIDASVTDSNQNDTVQIGGSNDETNSFSDINSDDDDDASTNDQILINKDNTNDNTNDSFSDISDRSLDELLNEFDSTDDDSSYKGKRPEKRSKHNSKSSEKPSRIKTTKNISPLKEERDDRSTSSRSTSSSISSNRIRTEMSKSRSKSSNRKRCHNENRHQFLTISLNCPKDGCHSKYSSASVLQDHMLAKHNSYAYVCPIAKCSKSFTSRSNMKYHGREDHKGIDSYVCRKCHFWNTDIDFVCTHYYMEHEEGQFKCTKSNCDHVSKCRADACKHANDH